MTITNLIGFPLSKPQQSYKRLNNTLVATESPIPSLQTTEPNSPLRHSKHLQRNINFITLPPHLIGLSPKGRAEAAVKSAKHILLTAEDVDLALLSVRNTPPAGHVFSPAQRLFGRTLRTDLPQSAATLEPRTSPRDTVVLEHLHRKSQQKKHTTSVLDHHFPNYLLEAMCMPSHHHLHWLRLGFLDG